MRDRGQRVALVLLRHEHGRRRVLAVAGREEGQLEHVVPVQVREHDRARERGAAEQARDRT